MENDFNLEQTLIKFNQDQDFIELRERYSTRSFLEIMSVERSENRHSSFLAWLFEAKDFAVNPKDHPIVHLLDILIRRKREQDTDCPKLSELKDIVLARDIKDIKLLEKITTEKTVGDATSNPIYEKIADRLDIYIKVALSSLQGEEHVFEIIIENKVGSTEGLPKKNEEKKWPEGYAGKHQTERYYAACQSDDRIFVFLTPISTQELDHFKDIHEEDKKSRDPHFININYQDLLDEVIEPLLANQNLSQRVHMLLEEYVLSLSLPGQYTDEDDKKLKSAIIMAERRQDVKTIEKLFENGSKYKPLIITAAKCLSNEDDYQKNCANWPKTKPYIEKREKKLKETICSSLDIPDDVNEDLDTLKHKYTLLVSFGKTYKNLFIAFLKSYIENQDNKEVDETLSVIKETYQSLLGAPKDRSEFTVENSNGVKELENDSKRSFAEFVIRKYIQYSKNDNTIEKPYDYFKIKENYPLCKDISSKDKTRYFSIPEDDLFISNQWGITRDQRNDGSKDESFDIIFKKIFGEPLYKLEESKEYSTKSNNDKLKLPLKEPWDKILSDYTITIKRINK